MYYVVTEPHNSTFPVPVQFSPGERLVLGKRDEEYTGWIWVTTASGLQGWAPEVVIRREHGDTGIALEDYTARELNTVHGERVHCLRELSGWLWVENADGRTGWIPGHTARVDSQQS